MVPTERQVLFLLNLGSVINYWVSVFVLVGVSSIVAVICYAWILASKGNGKAAVPVINMRQSRGCRQAAWLLYHVGVDTSALLFSDEVHHVIFDLNTPCCGVLRLTRP
jgi:hypothetical protein